MSFNRTFVSPLCACWLAAFIAATPVDGADGDVDFNRDIRPILSGHCFQCHGFDPKARQAELRLDEQSGLTAKLDSGKRAVEPGDPQKSELIARVTSADEDQRMPPADVSDPLTPKQIELLKDWIEQGAKWSEHWSFSPPLRPPLPAVSDPSWPANAIDYYVLARLDSERVKPSSRAAKETLLRRVSLDLIGLPPSLQEIESFLADDSPLAYQRLVDRLLASPHYGERMARRWLDLARYADSSGYANDNLRSVWPYRDWVVDALNADFPFDRFSIEQLAGDMLPNASQAQIVASGFHRNTPHQYEGGSDPEQYRVERVKNRLDTTGAVWLGLTVGCAQCHTHKFDPISQLEYYGLYAFFNSADEIKYPTPTTTQRLKLKQLESELAEVEAKLVSLDKAKRPPELTKRAAELKKSRDGYRKSFPTTLAFRERTKPRETFLQIRGDFLNRAEKVQPGTPTRLHPFSPPEKGRVDRLVFARWLMRPDNPLTARVAVNRAWQHFFGRGLVETENDFGHRGSPPTHPRLLDWLAREFVDSGYAVKRLHRLIVTSSAYRQSSHARRDLAVRDPRNLLIARQSRHRVEGEVIRDLALAASGMLSRKMGGRSVFPPIPPNVIGTSSARHRWPTSKGADRFRRGLYTAVYRANVYPMLSTFDGPDRDNACTRRTRSNTPLQALSLSNDPAMTELFRGLATRLLTGAAADDQQRMIQAFRICLGRRPNEKEFARLMRFHDRQRSFFQTHPDEVALVPNKRAPPNGASPADVAAWYAVSRLLMNLDEFVTRE